MTIFDRAMVREKTIWNPFSSPLFNADDETVRAVVFGLYSGVYIHGHDYLEDLQSEELAQIVDIYDQNIAQLTNDEAKLVIDHAAKRYLDSVDQLIHEYRVKTKQDEIAAEHDKWDARTAALEADEEALETLAIKAEKAVEDAETRIQELEAAITVESANYSMEYVNILEAQLRASRGELREAQAVNRGLEIQMLINRAANELSKIDVEIADTKVKTALVENDTAQITNKEIEIDILEQEVMNIQHELTAKQDVLIDEIEADGEIIQNQIDSFADLTNAENAELAARKSDMTADHTERLSRIGLYEDVGVQNAEERKRARSNDKTLATNRQTAQESIDASKMTINDAYIAASEKIKDAAIDAAEAIAQANMETELRHIISSS